MKLYSFSLGFESAEQSEKVSDREIEMIKKKGGYSKTRTLLIVLTSMMILAGIYGLIWVRELLPITCIALLIFIPGTIDAIKQNTVCSCYATVTEKKIRYARITGRGIPSVMPYERTESGEPIKKAHLFYNVCSYYYCSVKLNGKKYDHVSCYAKDFTGIETGDKVLIATIGRESEPVIYAIEL